MTCRGAVPAAGHLRRSDAYDHFHAELARPTAPTGWLRQFRFLRNWANSDPTARQARRGTVGHPEGGRQYRAQHRDGQTPDDLDRELYLSSLQGALGGYWFGRRCQARAFEPARVPRDQVPQVPEPEVVVDASAALLVEHAPNEAQFKPIAGERR